MWVCPACQKRFAHAGQVHSCGIVSLEHHFATRPRARALFDAFVRTVEKCGPVRLSIAKTRIGIITRITFAAVMPRKEYLRAHILLTRRLNSNRFSRIDHVPPYWIHLFEIRDEADLDEEVQGWLEEAYRAGEGR